MRSGYSPLCRKSLGHLLDEAYTEHYDEMIQNLKGKRIAILQDGWSNVHKEPIITHSVLTEGKAYLLTSIECKENSKTSEYCCSLLEEAIKKIRLEMNGDVIAVTTDNCPTMNKMRTILNKKPDYKDMFGYGCSPHMLNLLCEDISPKKLEKIVKVSKYFRNSDSPNALLSSKNGLRSVLPSATRWTTHRSCLEVFVKNRPKYIEIMQEFSLDPDIVKILNDYTILNGAKDLFVQLDVVTHQINILQSDSAKIADACHSCLLLLKEKILLGFKTAVLKRMNLCTEDFFIAAYLVHPKYVGELLSVSQKDKAFDFFRSVPASTVVTVNRFLIKDTTLFPKTFLEDEIMKTSNPIHWWSQMSGRSPELDVLVSFVMRLLSCPASTASVERIFSTYGNIQTKTRNNLSHDKLEKLAFLSRVLRENTTDSENPVDEN